MGEVVGQLGVSITKLPGIFPLWQEYCTKAGDGGRTRWSIIHWLDPNRMVSWRTSSIVLVHMFLFLGTVYSRTSQNRTLILLQGRFWDQLENDGGRCHKTDRVRAEQQTKKGAFTRN